MTASSLCLRNLKRSGSAGGSAESDVNSDHNLELKGGNKGSTRDTTSCLNVAPLQALIPPVCRVINIERCSHNNYVSGRLNISQCDVAIPT